LRYTVIIKYPITPQSIAQWTLHWPFIGGVNDASKRTVRQALG